MNLEILLICAPGGIAVKISIEEARHKVAKLINTESAECIIFTAGATEAINLVIWGLVQKNASKGKMLLASSIENTSVLNPLKDRKKSGFDLVLVPVDNAGIKEKRRY